MSTIELTKNSPAAEVAALIAGIKRCKRDEYWVLEPGEPFYEAVEAFEAINGDGPERTYFIRTIGADGQEVERQWDDVKPKLSKYELQRFKMTPNSCVLGTDGTVIISSGWYGRRESSPGVFEYLPDDEWSRWRNEQIRQEPRTISNRPFWASEVHPIHAWGVVDYVLEDGPMRLTQRMEPDGSMGEMRGYVDGIFQTTDELREIARTALALAERLESGDVDVSQA